MLPLHHAEIAQLVERQLPKLEVAGSNPVFRSNDFNICQFVLLTF